MRKTLISLLATLCIVTIAFVGCGDDKKKTEESSTTTTAAKAEEKSIVDLASENDDFSTLVELVKAAGLDQLLAGDGQYTVFAPTNAAFEKIDAATLAGIKANPEALQGVLTNHAISGSALKSSDLTDGQKLTTAAGTELTVGVKDGKITITDGTGNTVNVVQADIEASNGVIYAIDGILLPAGLAL